MIRSREGWGNFFNQEDGFFTDFEGNITLRTMDNKSDKAINVTWVCFSPSFTEINWYTVPHVSGVWDNDLTYTYCELITTICLVDAKKKKKKKIWLFTYDENS